MNPNEGDEKRQRAAALMRKAADTGRLIEAGWCALLVACKLENAPVNQRVQMRRAYFAGATHLFNALVLQLEPGAEATEKDMERMALIHDELRAFKNDLEDEAGVGRN